MAWVVYRRVRSSLRLHRLSGLPRTRALPLPVLALRIESAPRGHRPLTGPSPSPSSLPFPLRQVIVNARKPDFFISSMSLYEVVTQDGLMRPSFSLRRGGVYCGGSGGPQRRAGHRAQRCCVVFRRALPLVIARVTLVGQTLIPHLGVLQLASLIHACAVPQRRWWRRRWGWRATPSSMWETTFVSRSPGCTSPAILATC